jgi:uncharacterized membrane protein YjfL (UPF0719 family)
MIEILFAAGLALGGTILGYSITHMIGEGKRRPHP